jgi:hypothetical protein
MMFGMGDVAGLKLGAWSGGRSETSIVPSNSAQGMLDGKSRAITPEKT